MLTVVFNGHSRYLQQTKNLKIVFFVQNVASRVSMTTRPGIKFKCNDVID